MTLAQSLREHIEGCQAIWVVLTKLFGRIRPDLRLIAGPDGLRMQAKGEHHAVEYHDPEARGTC